MRHFRIVGGDEGGPRAGKLELPRGGEVCTPLFLPVATKMSVKTISSVEVRSTGTEAVITNGFLCSLQPGSDEIFSAGGMHTYMGWDGGLFSDSGGFQFIRKGFEPVVSDGGVRLRSPFDGSMTSLTPESVVEFHTMHGVDVGMVLDHCPKHDVGREELLLSSRLTVGWAKRSRMRIDEGLGDLSPAGPSSTPLFFAITQGGTDLKLRAENTAKLVDLGFDGYGIGGLSIGEKKEDTFRSLKASTDLLPVEKPRYFMGVGEPEDMIRSVKMGVDIFDSVYPTRNARHRSVFVGTGRENIRASGWKGMDGPIMEGCRCIACRSYSRGYIHHLFKAGEPLGQRLATIHNLTYIQELMKAVRNRILEGSYGFGLGTLVEMMFSA